MGKYLKKENIEEMKRIVEYLWYSEEKHYHECEKIDRTNHIFNSLRKVNEALDIKMEENEEDD